MHHLHVFRHNLPWWFRPLQNASEYSVADFVCDVRQQIESCLARLEPSMGTIFRGRKIFAQALSYRVARQSASVAKVGYSSDAFTAFIQEALAIMHACRRFGIPQGDPLYGKYGSAARDLRMGQTIYVNDLTVQEKQLVRWLHDEDGVRALLQQPEFAHYASRSPETRFALYAPDFRRKMGEILEGVDDDGNDEGWRDACLDLATDELIKVGGETQQQRVNDLTEGLPYDPLAVDPRRAITDLITPRLADPEKKDAHFALLEQLIVVAAMRRKLDDLLAIVDVWNRLMAIHNVAPCERPTGGLAAVVAKCAVEPAEAVRGWLGPQSTS